MTTLILINLTIVLFSSLIVINQFFISRSQMQRVIVIPYRKIRSQRTVTLCSLSLGSSLIAPLGSFLLLNTISILYEYDMWVKSQPLAFFFGVALELLSNIFMFLTVFTDPGIIPQQIRRYETQQELFPLPIAEEPTPPLRSYGIPQGNLFPEIKYCEECRIYRPVRTIHCGKCNHCVEIFDHHCTWIGVCIGKKNYRYFMAFLISLLAHLMLCIVFIIYVFLINLHGTILQILENSVIIIIVFAVSLFFFVSLSYLVGYQFSLLRRGVNMNEDLKSLYSKTCHQPFQTADLCFRTNAPPLIKQFYLFKAWNELMSIENNPEVSMTEKSHHTPLLRISDEV